MRLSLSRSGVGLALALAAITAGALTLWPREEPPSFYFQITMRASLPGFARLYYGVGSSAKEAHSVSLPVEGGNRDVDYKFPLPEGRHLNLRFDPTDRAENKMVLTRARVVTRSGKLTRPVPPGQIKALSQIEEIHAGEHEFTFTTAANADRPSLLLELGPPLLLKNYGQASPRTLKRRFLIILVPCALLSLLLTSALSSRIKSVLPSERRSFAAWARGHPSQLLFAIAAASVILSCYPVVFFGKSFLSPNNHPGSYLLYNEMPTVPGSSEAACDQEKGSDLGAAMWYSWPTSVVESRALLKHFELPLWNRYVLCGVPLLGQGQSMLGDPLHLLVLLTNGSPLAWDLKYLLAKVVFAACLGLCVLQLTRHLPAAIIMTASVPFIGFFSYRYSHPAFFSLCYAPFVLLCWFKFIEARRGRPTLLWLGLMVLANWTLMNSGTVKEAYVLLLCLNVGGFLFLLCARSVTGKAAKVRQALYAQVLFFLISTPVWLTFLNALRDSWTLYDAGAVFQIPPGRLIGLFDDIFYWQFDTIDQRLYPSANFLALLGVLWLCLSWRRADRREFVWALGGVGFCGLAFAFGLVPPALILTIPFIGRIYHIGNTFSCVALVYLLVLAGLGFKTFWNDCQGKEFKPIYYRFLLCLALLLGLYLVTAPIPKSAFFWGYAASLLFAIMLAPWIGRLAIKSRVRPLTPFFGLALIFVLVHWRHGMHLATPFDRYVMNPHQRTDLFAQSSPALQLIGSPSPEPFRSVGFKYNFFPGYGGAVGLEQVDGTDSLMNKYYNSLMDASGLKLAFYSARFLDPDDLESALPFFDMLNVRYFLGYAEGKVELARSVKKIAALDLDVYESSTLWPRAFFADRLVAYSSEADFVRLLQDGTGTPFAAISQDELSRHAELQALVAPPSPSSLSPTVPAKQYALTNNTTSFKVDAPRAGVLVLTEPYVENDFHLRVNGREADYFRVNSAFRGVFLPRAGEYHLSFSYWPRHLTISLWISAFGIILLLWWLGSAFKNSHGDA